MTSLHELSWNELVDRLRALQERAGESREKDDSASRLVHELHVYQVELEMQNRELRATQDRLEASRSRYAELYDHAPVGFATLDASGLILDMNLTGASLFGRPREQLIGLPLAAAAHASGAAVLSILQATMASGRPTTTELPFHTGRGLRVLEFTTARNDSINRSELRYLVTMTDVTEQLRAAEERRQLEEERQARAQADAANRMKDRFLGMVSHELRTPLNTILGWTQILSEQPGDERLFSQGLEAMQRNGEALARIVDDILDVSRIVSGKLGLQMKNVEMGGVVRSALEQARGPALAKKITLRDSIEKGCALIGDATRLQQVMTNLLSNALKFTPGGGQIAVTLGRGETSVTLTVRDNGAGIDPVDLPHVFEHFQQADSSSTRAYGGLGLGLAIARHIVEAHGGTIEARSDGRGKGAAFVVCLPMAAHSATSSRPPSQRAAEGHPGSDSLAGVKVLVVDDHQDGLELAALMLTSSGAVVEAASSVKDALSRITSFAPQVIVTDIAMPGQDGFDLIRRLRAMPPPLSAIPAIALTACVRADDTERILRAGFATHLGKPVDLYELVSVISTIAHAR